MVSRVFDEHLQPVHKSGVKYLTVVGMSGQGKSTTANILIGAPHFQVSAEPTSCTRELSHYEIPGTDRVVVDTPGLDDTAGHAHEIFQAITMHLREHGGIVVLVQSHCKLTEHLKKRFEAVTHAIGVPLATYCILVTTKPGYDRYRTANENRKDLYNYQQQLERGVNEHVDYGVFARKYVVSTHDEAGCCALQRDINQDVACIPGLSRGVVKPWTEILAMADAELFAVREKRKALQGEVWRSEKVVQVLNGRIILCRAAMVATSSIQLASVIVGVKALPAAVCAGTAMLWSVKTKARMQVELEAEIQNLDRAKDDIQHHDAITRQTETSLLTSERIITTL